MPPTNVQFRNAGNLGDVLKHAALLHLADLLHSRGVGRPIHWLDTHTFLLHAPLSDVGRWHATVGQEVERNPGYGAYEAAEAPWVARGSYRCSTGLVASRIPGVHLHLAESDPATRRLLEAQLQDEGRPAEHLLGDADAYLTAEPRSPTGAVLALVDPFGHPARFWGALDAALAAFRDPEADAIVLAFAYGMSPPAWPRPPQGCVGPVAVVERLPYGLAVYASPSVAAQVRAGVLELGWQPIAGDHGRFVAK